MEATTSTTSMTGFALPYDSVHEILSFSSHCRTVVYFGSTCRYYRDQIDADGLLWQKLCQNVMDEKTFGKLLQNATEGNAVRWRRTAIRTIVSAEKVVLDQFVYAQFPYTAYGGVIVDEMQAIEIIRNKAHIDFHGGTTNSRMLSIAGATRFASEILTNNDHVNTVDLAHQQIADRGFQQLVQPLTRCRAITAVSLASNSLTYASSQAIHTLITHAVALRSLDLSNNDSLWLNNVVTALEERTTKHGLSPLEQLQLNNVAMSAPPVQDFAELLRVLTAVSPRDSTARVVSLQSVGLKGKAATETLFAFLKTWSDEHPALKRTKLVNGEPVIVTVPSLVLDLSSQYNGRPNKFPMDAKDATAVQKRYNEKGAVHLKLRDPFAAIR